MVDGWCDSWSLSLMCFSFRRTNPKIIPNLFFEGNRWWYGWCCGEGWRRHSEVPVLSTHQVTCFNFNSFGNCHCLLPKKTTGLAKVSLSSSHSPGGFNFVGIVKIKISIFQHFKIEFFQLQFLWQEFFVSQYFHCVFISSASFLLLATPLSTCLVLTLKELRFRLERLRTRS